MAYPGTTGWPRPVPTSSSRRAKSTRSPFPPIGGRDESTFFNISGCMVIPTREQADRFRRRVLTKTDMPAGRLGPTMSKMTVVRRCGPLSSFAVHRGRRRRHLRFRPSSSRKALSRRQPMSMPLAPLKSKWPALMRPISPRCCRDVRDATAIANGLRFHPMSMPWLIARRQSPRRRMDARRLRDCHRHQPHWRLGASRRLPRQAYMAPLASAWCFSFRRLTRPPMWPARAASCISIAGAGVSPRASRVNAIVPGWIETVMTSMCCGPMPQRRIARPSHAAWLGQA